MSKTRQFRNKKPYPPPKFYNGTLEQLPSDPWPKKETGLFWGVWLAAETSGLYVLGPPGNMEFSFTSLPCRFAEAGVNEMLGVYLPSVEEHEIMLVHHSCPPSWIAKVTKNWTEAEHSGRWEHGTEAWWHRGTPNQSIILMQEPCPP